MGKNRVRRVMQKYGLAARRKKKKYVYPGKATVVAPNLVRELEPNCATEVVFSGLFEIEQADGCKVRGCFALWKRRRHALGLAFDYSMPAALVVTAVNMIPFEVPDAIFHSDQGKPFGAASPRTVVLVKGFRLSMSPAGRRQTMGMPNAPSACSRLW
jgi:putative transposase